ncbi:hypothetical protein NDU88_001076 [Pleurodeles waltl]|uniref:Uncharacterized protein n=1 Tax=Pleurodeles waltl TaxID=8319 RepID=A0AAV7UUA8_PLEWA|nr:hypothetical protein NDU88_001076 [Pleurodeles waltl]
MWLRPLGVFPPGRGSTVLPSSEVRVWSMASTPSRILSTPCHTSGPERPRQEGPLARHQLGRGSPAPAAILFCFRGPVGPRHGNGARFL